MNECNNCIAAQSGLENFPPCAISSSTAYFCALKSGIRSAFLWVMHVKSVLPMRGVVFLLLTAPYQRKKTSWCAFKFYVAFFLLSVHTSEAHRDCKHINKSLVSRVKWMVFLYRNLMGITSYGYYKRNVPYFLFMTYRFWLVYTQWSPSSVETDPGASSVHTVAEKKMH